jgi:Beta/Gamma crystallin
LPFALARRVRRKNEKEKGADMRKFIILMAALAVAAAVQTSPRAFAQTATASKDAGSTTTLTAEQKKKPVVQSAPVRTIARPTTKSVSHPTTKSFTRPTSTTRSVVKSTKPISPVVKKTVTHVPTGNKTLTHVPSGNKTLTHVPGGKKTLTQIPSGKKTLTQIPGGKKTLTQVPGGKKTLTHVPGGKKTLTQIPGGKKTLTLGPGGKKILSKGLSSKFAKTDGRHRIGINRDRRRIFVNNRWRTLIPLIALGTFMYEDETYYADGYVSMAEPGCTGYAEDGSRLRWMAVPTEDGGTEYQCVSYSTQRNRTVTEIVVPEEPMAEAPPVAEPETVGVGPASEPAGASPPPAAPATGCELLIYSEANFKGLSAPVDENQSSLSEDGWQNEIASVEIKSGTWDFYSDEDYAGEMMRLSAGSYPTLDPKWTKHIGSFMCSTPAK